MSEPESNWQGHSIVTIALAGICERGDRGSQACPAVRDRSKVDVAARTGTTQSQAASK